MIRQHLRSVVFFLAEPCPVFLLRWRLLDPNNTAAVLLLVLLAVVVICVGRLHVIAEVTLELDLVLSRVSAALGLVASILVDLMNFRRILTALLLQVLPREVRVLLGIGCVCIVLEGASRVPGGFIWLRVLASKKIWFHLGQRFGLVASTLDRLAVRPLGDWHVGLIV